MEWSMFRKTIHPLDLLLAVLAAVTPGAAIFYWLAGTGRVPVAFFFGGVFFFSARGGLRFDFLFGVVYLLTAASVMLAVIGGMIWFAVWFFSPHRQRCLVGRPCFSCILGTRPR